MSLFDRFKKGKKAESAYFESRQVDEDGERKETLPPYLLRSGKKLEKGLFIDLLRALKSHDLKASVGIFSNTTDNIKKETGLVINKGVVSKKIVAYLQDIRMNHVEKALEHVKTMEPDKGGFYTVDDRLAGRLNLPADVIILPVFSDSRPDMGLIVVARNSIANPSKLLGQIKKLIK